MSYKGQGLGLSIFDVLKAKAPGDTFEAAALEVTRPRVAAVLPTLPVVGGTRTGPTYYFGTGSESLPGTGGSSTAPVLTAPTPTPYSNGGAAPTVELGLEYAPGRAFGMSPLVLVGLAVVAIVLLSRK